jgi:hypothetical protein
MLGTATLYPVALTTFSSSIALHKIDLGLDLALKDGRRLSLGGTVSGTAPADDTGNTYGAPYVAGFFAGLGIKL